MIRNLAETGQTKAPARALAMRSPQMGTWTLQLPERSVSWSPELEEVFGMAPGSFAGTQAAFHNLVHAADLPRLEREIARSLQSGEEYCVIFRYRHSSGEWRWMEGRGLPAYDQADRPVRIDGIGIDVTERTMAEHMRFRLAAIVESSDDAIISKTLEGIITSWNAGATRLFGYTDQEMIGKSILTLIPPELHSEESGILAKLRSGEHIQNYETHRVTKDGSRVDVSLTVSPVRDVTGAIVGASKIARDIGALRQTSAEREQLLISERNARAEAERLGHLKDEFLATLSHELRTPLTAILGWATLLKRHATLPPEQISAAVETIYRNAKAQAQIIDDLLDMSRIISGKIRLQTEALDLMEVVQVAVDGIQPVAEAKQISVELLPASDPVLAAGDAGRLQQVLWNLLTNAVKFTPPGGSIIVATQTSGEYAQIRVRDTGAGIKADFLPFLFERFRQADASSTREHSGLGLGLSIVRNLVELHGGTVAVESAGEGRGTEFTVRLPALHTERFTERSERPAEEIFDSADPVSLAGVAVLVVDDAPDGRTLLERLLSEAGARVHTAESAPLGIQALQNHPVDIILSDISMPGMDGVDFIRHVRKLRDPAVSNIPAIAVTAYARKEDRDLCLAAGFQRHIAKPYSIAEVASAVATVLKARAA